MKNSTGHYLKLISVFMGIALTSACADRGNSDDEGLAQITHENASEIAGTSYNRSTTYNGSTTLGFTEKGTTLSRSLTIPVVFNSDSRSTDTRVAQTLACPDGGSITIISTDDLNGDGDIDAAKFRANNCYEAGSLIDGELRYEVTSTSAEDEIVLNSEHLSITYQSETTIIDNMRISITVSNTGFSADYDMELTSSEGKVIIKTDPPFTGSGSSVNYPDTGKMTIRGANGSSIILDADTGLNPIVQVTVSDGVSTQSHTVSWISLSYSEFSL